MSICKTVAIVAQGSRLVERGKQRASQEDLAFPQACFLSVTQRDSLRGPLPPCWQVSAPAAATGTPCPLSRVGQACYKGPHLLDHKLDQPCALRHVHVLELCAKQLQGEQGTVDRADRSSTAQQALAAPCSSCLPPEDPHGCPFPP